MNAHELAEIRKELKDAGYTFGGSGDMIIIKSPDGEVVAGGPPSEYEDMLLMAVGHLEWCN